MTFGIDIAGYQLGIDLVRARAEGTEFVIVKASGFNTGSLYVANGYHTLIDRAILSGFEKTKGHYYLIGGGQKWLSPTEQARYFVSKLYRFDVRHDILMLDNEGLDSNGYLFDDAEVEEFCREVIRLTGISARQIWVYAGASDWRNMAPWPLTVAANYRRVWAAYGNRPSGQTPDHQPSLQGSIPSVDVHQFTSNSLVADMSVDGNYSQHSISTLFNASGTAGGGTTPIEEDDMFTDEDRNKLYNTYAAVWYGGTATIDGVPQKFNYGVLPISAHTQKLIGQLIGQVNGLAMAVAQIGSGNIDIAAIEAAAREGAEAATVLDETDLRQIAAFVAADVIASLPDDVAAPTADQIADLLAQRLSA